MGLIALAPTHMKSVEVESLLGRGRLQETLFEDCGPSGQAYWNCRRYAARTGGTVVYGWQVFWWPHLFFKLTHHAVVRDRSGQLVDVTTCPVLRRETGLFLEDASIVPSLDRAAFIPDIFVEIGIGLLGPKAIANASSYQVYLEKRLAELSGGVPRAQIEARGGFPDMNAEIRELMIKIDECSVDVDRAIAICEMESAEFS